MSRLLLRRRRGASGVVQGGGGGGDWPNDPGGTLYLTEGFASKALATPPLGGVWEYSTSWDDPDVAVVSSDDPISAPGAIRWIFDAGRPGGDSPGRAVYRPNGPFYTTYYIGLYARWSVPWTNHSSGVNKIYYWGEGGAYPAVPSQFMLNRRGTVIDVILQHGQSPDSQRIVPSAGNGESRLASTSVNDSTWHRLELLCNASTGGLSKGRLRVWVDSILQFDLSDISYAPSGNATFYAIDLDPVWGGIGDTKPQEEWVQYGHMRIVGIA